MNTPKPTPILPPGQPEERPLFVIMTIMAFLAALTLMATLLGMRQSQSWQNDLKSAATLQIFTKSGDTNESELNKAIQLLEATSGITSIDVVSDQESRALIRPWIGNLDLPTDIDMPSLIRLNIDRGKFDASALAGTLQAEGLITELDDHAQWSQNLSHTWGRVRLALLSLLTLMIVSTIAIASFATQSVLRSRKNIINVLGQVGASDHYIARLFVNRFMSLGFKAAITGVVLAIIFAVIFLLWQNAGTDNTGLKLSLKVSDIIWLLLLAIILGGISALTAGRNTLSTIRKLPRS